MMKKLCSLILSAAVTLLLFHGCCFSGEASRTITLTEKESGKTFPVHVGDVIFVRLSENPTTGYQWKAVPAVKGKNILKLSGEDYLPPKDETLCGAPGTKSFGYLVAGTGKTDLVLESRRSWLKGSKDVRKIVFHVIAEPQVK